MSTSRSDLHIGSTITRLPRSQWRIVVHWHSAVDKEGRPNRRRVVPAGVEVRCYGVRGDDEGDFWGGQEHPRHGSPIFGEGETPRAASSALLAGRVKWGQVLAEQRAKLASLLGRSASETSTLHAGSAQLMRDTAGAAGPLRATDETYRLVADLYRWARADKAHRSRAAVYVLDRLVADFGYPLDRDNDSDRVKVRQWIAEARKRGYLWTTPPPPNRKGDSK